MKKNLILAIALFGITRISALPVGNPSDASCFFVERLIMGGNHLAILAAFLVMQLA